MAKAPYNKNDLPMDGGRCFDLTGKVAVVTGGSGIYGYPISEGLAEAGATVIIASRKLPACREVADELAARGFSADAIALDLSSDGSIAEFTAELSEKHGHADILVNNAVNRFGMVDLDKANRHDLALAQDVNVNGTMMVTKALIPGMIEAGGGSIINISSIQGVMGPHFPYYDPDQSSPVEYTFEKWGLIGFTKWLCAYYGKYNIRANAISPGGLDPKLEETRPKFFHTYAEHTPLKKWPYKDDIKGPVIFLAADASRYVTGVNLMMDGGFTVW